MALKNFRQRCGGRKQGKQHKFEKKPTNPAMLSQQNNPTKNPTPPIIYSTVLSVFAHKIQQ